ncbi:MAG TPA: DNA-processing protein DprA [Patescibacteria group bacterium]|nr:DNA-processing protein DprA [Patescibacteria group bacterium]
MKVNKVSLHDKDFPEILRDIPSPPKELYIWGNLAPLLVRSRLAVVGSRKITPYGQTVTTRFAREAAEQGIVIVSGLAYGADSIAHRACLEVGGQTIAILPTGLDTIYPAAHRGLAKQIVEKGGAVISEYPPKTTAYAVNFIARNRLVSGISDGVLITEAALKSGTLHTANFALNQGRTVMAVPGNITSPGSVGTNNLIKAGAVPVTDISDVFLALDIAFKPITKDVLASSREEAAILEALNSGAREVNELLSVTGLETALFNQTLTMLEINGKIRPMGSGKFGLL